MTKEFLEDNYPETILMTGYEDCILGICNRYGQDSIVAYDLEKVLAKLMKDGMTYEEAVDWYEFNMIGSWCGDTTPCFVDMSGM